MLPPDVEIVGAVVEIVDGDLCLRLALSDGSTGGLHWPLPMIAQYAEVLRPAPRAPTSAYLH